MTVCCPCDEFKHPRKPEIPAGLPALPRQLAGFPEYRLAMLREIAIYAPLAHWRAREGDDLGVMLIEMWSYVLDILGFYDERIANESYLRTALLRPSVRKLTGLIGYRPRPALAASVVLAAIADGNSPVRLPPRTGFRSSAFDGEPPQVFETEFEQAIHPLKNEWTLGPVRGSTVSDRLLLESDTARLARDQIAVFVWPTPRTCAGLSPSMTFEPPSLPDGRLASLPLGKQASFKGAAGKVRGAKAVEARDGRSYIELAVDPPPRFDPEVRLADVRVLSPTLSAALAVPTAARSAARLISTIESSRSSIEALLPQVGGRLAAGALLPVPVVSPSSLQLDAVYKQLHEDDIIVISRGSEFRVLRVVDARETELSVGEQVTMPVTEIRVLPPLPAAWQAALRSLTVHFNMVDGGRLTRVAQSHVNAGDFAPPGVAMDGLVEPLPESLAQPSEFLLLDARHNGALAHGTAAISEKGEGRVQLDSDTGPFDPPLRAPVRVFGNLVRATRGESVVNEVLGSGDAAQPFQSFALRKKPLTYFNDPSAPSGRRSALEVRVNGIQWKKAASFFGSGPQDEVFIVRQNDEEETVITFGDGSRGSRLPSGMDNVTATYRFGAGAAKPPPGAIRQLFRPVEGLRRVVNPLVAGGGADADRPKDMRRNAPDSALILGRAVSLPDFEALAREFGGVVNARAEWAWDETRQSAVVKVWFISDGGNIAAALETFLIGQADPTTPLVAEAARAQVSELVIDLEIDPRFNLQSVVERVKETLANRETGMLARENIPIGCPLFRSRIFEAVLSVEGARSVRGITVDGQAAPFAVTARDGRYRDFLDALLIHGTPAAGRPVEA